MVEQDARSQWGLVAGWTAVYAFNLFLPLLFARETTSGGGRIGMLAAITLMWGGGAVLCLRTRRPGWALIVGGAIISLTQFFPILHIVAGGIALDLWAAATGEQSRGLSEAGGFFVTLMTGQPLVLAAVLVGYVANGICSWPDAPAAESGEAAV